MNSSDISFSGLVYHSEHFYTRHLHTALLNSSFSLWCKHSHSDEDVAVWDSVSCPRTHRPGKWGIQSLNVHKHTSCFLSHWHWLHTSSPLTTLLWNLPKLYSDSVCLFYWHSQEGAGVHDQTYGRECLEHTHLKWVTLDWNYSHKLSATKKLHSRYGDAFSLLDTHMHLHKFSRTHTHAHT